MYLTTSGRMRPLMRKILIVYIAVFALLVQANPALSQTFPTRPIRIITAPAGGGTGGGDFVTRLVAQAITGPLGQTVVVENRPTTTIGGVTAKSPPDGYTLALLGNSFWLSPLIEKTDYDPVADFVSITFANRSPEIIVVPPSLPVNSVKDFIDLAKAHPGELNYAGGASGSASVIAAELFISMAGVKLTRVNYSGGEPAVLAVVKGEVQVRFASEAATLIKAGKLKALAVTSLEPSDLAPGLPPVSATVPGYSAEVLQAVFAPVKTPGPIVARLNKEIVAALNSTEIKDRFFAGGSEPYPTTPEITAAVIKQEIARMGKLASQIQGH